MADPLTWQLLAAAQSCLSQVRTANGYNTDAGEHVTDEPETLVPESQASVIGVAMTEIQPASDDRMKRTHKRVLFSVVAKVAVDRKHAQAFLHELLEDLERSFAGKQSAFPTGVSFPVFEGATPIPPPADKAWIGAHVRFSSHVLRRQPT
jgi:hypothetical protein